MCYYTASNLSQEKIIQLEHDFVVRWEEEDRDEYFVASGFDHPKLPAITAENRFKSYRWGLIPHWVKDWQGALKSRTNCLNSVSEEAETKPSFRDAIKAGQFCILPVTGFYEWHHQGNEKYPHFIYPAEGEYFLMAGLFNQWINKAIDEVHDTFTILTTKANERMEWIHNSKKRMPVILNKDQARAWLHNGVPYKSKMDLLQPCPSEMIKDHPISKLITSRKENPNQAKVMEKFQYPELQI